MLHNVNFDPFFPPMARQKILEPFAQERALIYNSTYFYPN